jgi:hypothetical protein
MIILRTVGMVIILGGGGISLFILGGVEVFGILGAAGMRTVILGGAGMVMVG